MRRRLLIMMIWLAFAAIAKAQSGLNVAPLFDGKIIPQERMVETRVKGKALSKYQLSFFRSVRFEAKDTKEIKRVRELIEQDLRHVVSSSQSQTGHSKETLMMQLSLENGQNRFLCYKRQNSDITVVYMEGSLSSFETLKSILK